MNSEIFRMAGLEPLAPEVAAAYKYATGARAEISRDLPWRLVKEIFEAGWNASNVKEKDAHIERMASEYLRLSREYKGALRKIEELQTSK